MKTAVIRRFPTPGTQTYRVLKELLEANGEWVNGRYFLNVMKLSQYHEGLHGEYFREGRH